MVPYSGSNLSQVKEGRSRGFSLLEVMLAIVVILLGLVPLLSLLVKCIHVHYVSESLTQGTLQAENKMSELLADRDLAEKHYQGRCELAGSDIEYRWSADVEPFAEPLIASMPTHGLWHVTLTVTWIEADKDKEVTLDTVVQNPNPIRLQKHGLNTSKEGTSRGTL